jgi:hypothetical protein
MPDAFILATADVHVDIETVLCGDTDWPKITGLDCNVELIRSRLKAEPVAGALLENARA